MKDLAKTEAKKRIDSHFSKDKLDTKETRKIKRLAMSHRIRLKEERKRFCKKCFRDLSEGKVRISKGHKNVICRCGFANRWKI